MTSICLIAPVIGDSIYSAGEIEHPLPKLQALSQDRLFLHAYSLQLPVSLLLFY